MGCGKRRLGWVRHKAWFIKGYSPIYFCFYLNGTPKLNSPLRFAALKLTEKPIYCPIPFLQGIYGNMIFVYDHILIWERNTKHGDLGYVSSHSWTWRKRRSSCMLVMTGIMRIGQNDFVPHGICLEEVAVVQGVGKFKLLTTDRFRPTLQLVTTRWIEGFVRAIFRWSSVTFERRAICVESWEEFSSQGYQFLTSSSLNDGQGLMARLRWHKICCALWISRAGPLFKWRQHWGSWGVLPGRRVPHQDAQPEGSPNKTGDFVCMGCTSLHIWRLDTEWSSVSSFAISPADLCPASGRYGWKYNFLISTNPTLFHG